MLKERLSHSGFVAVVGAPNTGKSTFINTVLGKKVTIVSPKVQTTRTPIRGIYTTEEAQLVFVDTPGITPTDLGKELNRWMNRTATARAKEADLVLFFVDATLQHPEQGVIEEDRAALEKITTSAPIYLVVNKCDAVKKMRVDDTIAVLSKAYPFAGSFRISALSGDGIPSLLTRVIEHLPEGPQYFEADVSSDLPDEQFAAEIIREKIFLTLHQELPYHTAVTVEEITDHETRPDILIIRATIHVARSSQKAIVIGEKGSMLKKIGSFAREELEHLFGKKIFLHLHVRVEEKWFDNERLLRKMGFEEEP